MNSIALIFSGLGLMSDKYWATSQIAKLPPVTTAAIVKAVGMGDEAGGDAVQLPAGAWKVA
jgi:hypothetical protein